MPTESSSESASLETRSGERRDGAGGAGPGQTPPPPNARSADVGTPGRRAGIDRDGASGPLDRVVRFLLWAAALGAIGWGIWYFAGLVFYLVLGAILAYLLRPMVDRFQGTGIGRVTAIFLAFAVLLGMIGVAVTFIVPFVVQQAQELSQLVSIGAARDAARYIEDWVRQYAPLEEGVLVGNVDQVAKALVQGDLIQGDRVAQTVSSVVSVFTNIVYGVVIVPFVTFFLLKDELQIRRDLLSVVPNRYFEVTLAILEKVEVNIGRYFRALLVQCTSIAIMASVLLWFVGLESAVAIGIFTGLANMIPYFGPFLGFLCGALAGIAQTGNLVLIPGVALAMAITQLADNVFLQPLIFSKAAKAHPIVILFVVLIGARLAGIVGMLVAIPLTTTIRVIVEQLVWSFRNYRILRTPS